MKFSLIQNQKSILGLSFFQWTALLFIVGTVLLRTCWSIPGPISVPFEGQNVVLNLSPVVASSVLAGLILPVQLAMLVPVVSMFSSDVILYLNQLGTQYSMSFFDYMSMSWMTYSLMILVTLGSSWLSKVKLNRIVKSFIAGVSGSSLFWMISNFFVWLIPAFNFGMYPLTFEGFVSCYVAAIPFGQSDLASTIIYMSAFFTVYLLTCLRLKKTREVL
jgi:hypothetical protein